MKQYTWLQPHRRNLISLYGKRCKNVDKPTKNRYKTVLVWVGVLAFTWPVFRSGLKSNLTLFEFIINHTIWGDTVEYIPKEDYQELL